MFNRHTCASNVDDIPMLLMQMRNTKTVSVFPVAFSGGLAFEGPICKDSKAVKWQAVWQSKERLDILIEISCSSID